nr:D-aminoacid aminotransferase-like PLP-dependent enzymes superfamily protein [Tanacetum cinerariifolium]
MVIPLNFRRLPLWWCPSRSSTRSGHRVCLKIGIPVREVAPSWSKRYLWEEAFITNGLRLLQHVETIRVPVSWNSLSSKTWKEVTWEAKEFEEGSGSITMVIQIQGYALIQKGIIQNFRL